MQPDYCLHMNSKAIYHVIQFHQQQKNRDNKWLYFMIILYYIYIYISIFGTISAADAVYHGEDKSLFSPISAAIYGTLLCYFFIQWYDFCFTTIFELNLIVESNFAWSLKSRILFIYFFYKLCCRIYLFLIQIFLQHPGRILNIPDKMIVHKVDAWFSAQFLIKHISFQYAISSLWHVFEPLSDWYYFSLFY